MTNDWDVILVAGTRFGGNPPLGDWQLARALANRHRVLYVEPPISAHRYRQLGQPRLGLERVDGDGQGIHVLRKLTVPGHNRPRPSALTNRVLASQINRAAKRLFGRPAVLITFDPKRDALRPIDRRLMVYWLRDQLTLSANTRYPEQVSRLHRRLLKQADLVTAVSEPLMLEARPVAHSAIVIPNGCDFAHFSKAQRREKADQSVTVGYMGGVSWRLDMDLIASLAGEHPSWNIVLVGQVQAHVPRSPNVHVVGPVPYSHLPNVLQDFDVGIIPYRLDGFNHASFPLKVFEYLAAGIPVVSTPLPSMVSLSPHVRVAADADGFGSAIHDALRSGPPAESCRQVAKQNAWDSRARTLEGAISDRLSGAVESGRPDQRVP